MFCWELVASRSIGNEDVSSAFCLRPGNREGKDLVEEMMRNASTMGLNVARVYAHTSDPEHPILVSLSHAWLVKDLPE